MIIVYTKPDCEDSQRAIELFKKAGVSFEKRVVNPTSPPLELAALGHTGHYPFVVLIREEPTSEQLVRLYAASIE